MLLPDLLAQQRGLQLARRITSTFLLALLICARLLGIRSGVVALWHQAIGGLYGGHGELVEALAVHPGIPLGSFGVEILLDFKDLLAVERVEGTSLCGLP